MVWIKRLLKAWAIARVIIKQGDVLMTEAAQLKAAYTSAIDASSEGGSKVLKAEWQRIAKEAYDVVALVFSWRK